MGETVGIRANSLSVTERVSALFAKRLKQARELRGLSQRQLGGMVDSENDKNRGAVRINRYEQEVNLADMEKASELAKALNVPMAYLFAESDELAEMILAFDSLNEKEQIEILAEIKKLLR